jgi:hypothetical protein
MKRFPLLVALSLALLVAAAFAQTAGDAARGSTPPGMSQDGSRPAEGAITGGQPIVPGESAGMPNKGASATGDERLTRCYEMSGSLREECLRKERSAAGGTAPEPAERIEVPGKGDVTTK